MREIYVREIERQIVGANGMPRTVRRLVHVCALRPGDQIWVEDIVGPTVDDVAKVTEYNDGYSHVCFKTHAIATLEWPDENYSSCVNLRFARTNRPWSERPQNFEGKRKRRVLYSRVLPSKRYAAALFKAGYKPVKIPGGAQYALAFAMNEYGEGAEVIVPAPIPAERELDIPVKDSKWVFVVRNEDLNNALRSLNRR